MEITEEADGEDEENDSASELKEELQEERDKVEQLEEELEYVMFCCHTKYKMLPN